MVETSEILIKRRNRSSNSSTSDSPETKPQNSLNYSVQPHVEGDDEPPLTAPSTMSANVQVQKMLQEILQKLGKLDVIEQSVNNLQATLLKLEARTQTLESFQVSASKDINDLKERLNFSEEKYKSKLESVHKDNKNINLKFTNLEKENQELHDKINKLKTKRLYLEAYSHRENIKFENIIEFNDGSDKENTEQVEIELGFMDARFRRNPESTGWEKEGKRAKAYSRQSLEVQGLRKNSFPGKTSKRQQLQDVSGFTV